MGRAGRFRFDVAASGSRNFVRPREAGRAHPGGYDFGRAGTVPGQPGGEDAAVERKLQGGLEQDDLLHRAAYCGRADAGVQNERLKATSIGGGDPEGRILPGLKQKFPA